ncbi:hypothetical protein K9M47_02590 [Candidatus Gracilibacteria bacterium]|nr:hypothetical protein [Candidatus Gracilibacteria bacterium]MCF7898945.1 hypothetical protein [Candidatus Paceibacterota bacterium]
MEHLENIPTLDKSVFIANMMQIKLAQSHSESIDDFINLHAVTFRETLDAHPDLIEKFEIDPEATLTEIGKYLYH